MTNPMNHEAARLRAWLRRIALRCRGLAYWAARDALESDRWPDAPRTVIRDAENYARRRRKPKESTRAKPTR